ncbi:hypothetical protein GCM10022226_57820 [Sphaerisporangium flaviroseum]|uniref:Uncharacterized protein n=1 Tax=Sphaerisporangium flaviroseum TaxID=509199 RepID=A0ABP7IYJ3_9ACTN
MANLRAQAVARAPEAATQTLGKDEDWTPKSGEDCPWKPYGIHLEARRDEQPHLQHADQLRARVPQKRRGDCPWMRGGSSLAKRGDGRPRRPGENRSAKYG